MTKNRKTSLSSKNFKRRRHKDSQFKQPHSSNNPSEHNRESSSSSREGKHFRGEHRGERKFDLGQQILSVLEKQPQRESKIYVLFEQLNEYASQHSQELVKLPVYLDTVRRMVSEGRIEQRGPQIKCASLQVEGAHIDASQDWPQVLQQFNLPKPFNAAIIQQAQNINQLPIDLTTLPPLTGAGSDSKLPAWWQEFIDNPLSFTIEFPQVVHSATALPPRKNSAAPTAPAPAVKQPHPQQMARWQKRAQKSIPLKEFCRVVEQILKYEDLTHIPLVTIDGQDARDFDDAVFAEEHGDHYLLVVAIANVTRYIYPQTDLDEEAIRRGNSFYFAEGVIPQFPEPISNGICSLNPDVPRSAVFTTLRVFKNPEKAPQLASVRFGLMKSRRRYTYSVFQKCYDYLKAQGQGPTAAANKPGVVSALVKGLRGAGGAQQKAKKSLLPAADGYKDTSKMEVTAESISTVAQADKVLINALYSVFEILDIRRKARPNLNLELPEYSMLLDAKKVPSSLFCVYRETSHKVIEECMILNNQAIAALLNKNQLAGAFRNHPGPTAEKVQDLKNNLRLMGIDPNFVQQRIKSAVSAPLAHPAIKDALFLSEVCKVAEEKKLGQEVFKAVLRTTGQALYQNHQDYHFGLGIFNYLHFTSPIRRIADMWNHRVIKFNWLFESHLKNYWGEPSAQNAAARKNVERFYDLFKVQLNDYLMEISKAANVQERLAQEATWFYNGIKRARYAAAQPQTRMLVTVSNCIEKGVFAEELNTGLDGFIPIRNFEDDFYVFNSHGRSFQGRRLKRKIRTGTKLWVEVQRVDLTKGRITYQFLEFAEKAD